MTTSVQLKLPRLPCRPNALLASEILSSGKCFRFVLPGLSLRSIAWCSHFVSFHGETSGGKDNPKENKRGKSTERVPQDFAENNLLPPLIFPECMCNFGVCGSWAIRRTPHLQYVSDRSHRADRDDVVVWKLEELVCVAKVRGHENTSNKVPSDKQWREFVVVICRFCPNTSLQNRNQWFPSRWQPDPLVAVAFENEELFAILFRHRDGAVEPPVDTVVLVLVDHVIVRDEGVVAHQDSQTRHGTRAFQYDRSH